MSWASGASLTGEGVSSISNNRWPDEDAREKLFTIIPDMRTGIISMFM